MSYSHKRTFELSAKKRAFLEMKLREEGVEAARSGRIVRRQDTGVVPLSFAQQRLWFLDQLAPGNPFYNLPVAVQLTGVLQIEVLRQSLGIIVQRHESLRTTFAIVDGQPAQVIAPQLALPLPLLDLSALPLERRVALDKQLVARAAQQPFDLAHGPLLRTLLLRLAPQEHVLLLTMHHSISDGWSVEIFFRELGLLYTAACMRRTAPLPPLQLQYADYAIWQRQWLQGAVLDAQLAYWKAQLAGAPALLDLPTDHPRPPVQTFDGTSHSFSLAKELSAKLTLLSRQEGVTLFMTVLAIWQVLLARYTRQRDIVVGTPIAGRTRSEVEELIGFFANTLVIRTDMAGNPSFQELLGRVRKVCLGAYAHQDLPFEKLVEELRLERNLSFNPLFQALFGLQEGPITDAQFAGLALNNFPVNSGTAKVDISLMMTNGEQGLTGTLTGSVALFEPATIARMVDHFQKLLEGICADPRRRLADIPIVTAAEQQMRMAWNATQQAYPDQACIHQLFEAQVEHGPDAIALVFDRRPMPDSRHAVTDEASARDVQQLTYRELNRRANQLAHTLRRMGIGLEMRVGLCMTRSLDMVIGLLAILKAGGAYVPLDPAYPAERLAFMLADARMPVLLTQEHLLVRLPKHTAQVICLDRALASSTPAHDQNLTVASTPDQLAYVIYTSGSTGKPKGILVRHRGVCNVIPASIAAFGIGTSSRVLQLASLSFDASVLELFTALLSGAALHVVMAENVGVPIALAHLMQSHAISMIALPPSLLEVLPHEPFPALRTIVVGGEHCSAETVMRWAPGRCFVNAYAPTEATIYATSWIGTETSLQGPPLGRPIANMQVYLLDAHLQSVPDSVPGEIHLGGVGVVLGYLNRPELTAERFIPNPFRTTNETATQNSAETRLYKTGDLARYRSDGTLEFLGRVDTQVKLRGFRIELGEIEAVLAQHPALHEVVVVVREDATSASGVVNKRLVAYVVLQAEASVTMSELRDFLKERLPAYMVPATFVTLQDLPLTENGKVDYRALPVLDTGRSELETTFVAPRTATEELLTTIWAELLGKERVGIHDNFFELGGHSLLATRLILRLRDALHIDLPLRYLFDTLTVAGLAEAIATLQRITPNGSDDDTLIACLHREATLDPTIVPGLVPHNPIAVPTNIFLTGATGFLGAFLLHELLQQTSAAIYCLVRAADFKEGICKLQQHLKAYNLWEVQFSQRLVPVIGDLSLPQLGLSTEQFYMLANMVEAIYHNGAQVNFLYPYERLKTINVLGTQEVLRLACCGTVKPVHYISTLSVFPSYGYSMPKEINEQNEPEQCEGLYSGYAQSKWVAEKLVRVARDRGVPVCIYRPATITGDSKTGRSHPDDYTSRLIKGCIQLGSARDYDRKMYFTPVDFVSKAIIHLSLQPKSYGKAFHLINPQPMLWSELIHWTQAYGYPLELCSFDEWRTQLSDSARDSQENGLYAFLPMFFDEQVAEMERANWFRFMEFTCDETLAMLADSGISCPPLDDALLQTYFAYFIRSGFLPAPVVKDEKYQSFDAQPSALGQPEMMGQPEMLGQPESERGRWSLSMIHPAFG